jgi:hypothetical protein
LMEMQKNGRLQDDGGGKKLGHFGGVSGATVVVDIWNCGSAYNERTDGRLKSGRALMV